MAKNPLTITVKRCRVLLVPAVDVFHVTLGNVEEEWKESFGSEIETRAFLRGVKACSRMLRIASATEHEIPSEPAIMFSSEREQRDDSNFSDDSDLFPNLPF